MTNTLTEPTETHGMLRPNTKRAKNAIIYPEFPLCLYPFIYAWTGGSLVIAEHAQAIWVDRSELQNYDWAEAGNELYLRLIAYYRTVNPEGAASYLQISRRGRCIGKLRGAQKKYQPVLQTIRTMLMIII